MAKKKVSKKKKVTKKKTSNKKRVNKKQTKAKYQSNKKRIVINNLVIFLVLFFVSLISYSVSTDEVALYLFYLFSIVFGFISLGLLIATLVLYFLKIFKK